MSLALGQCVYLCKMAMLQTNINILKLSNATIKNPETNSEGFYFCRLSNNYQLSLSPLIASLLKYYTLLLVFTRRGSITNINMAYQLHCHYCRHDWAASVSRTHSCTLHALHYLLFSHLWYFSTISPRSHIIFIFGISLNWTLQRKLLNQVVMSEVCSALKQ